jgi:hypothetical protein
MGRQQDPLAGISTMHEAKSMIKSLTKDRDALSARVQQLELLHAQQCGSQDPTPALSPTAIVDSIKTELHSLLRTQVQPALEALSTSLGDRITHVESNLSATTASITATVNRNVSSHLETIDAKVVGLAAELHAFTKATPQQQPTNSIQEQLATTIRELPMRTANLNNFIVELPSPIAANPSTATTAITTTINAAMEEAKTAALSYRKATNKPTTDLDTAPAFDLREHLVSVTRLESKPNQYKVRLTSPDTAKRVLRDAKRPLRDNHSTSIYEDLTYTQREHKRKLQPLFRALQLRAGRTGTKKPFWEGGLIRHYQPGSTMPVDHVCNWDLGRLQQELTALQEGASTSQQAAAPRYNTRSRRPGAQQTAK